MQPDLEQKNQEAIDEFAALSWVVLQLNEENERKVNQKIAFLNKTRQLDKHCRHLSQKAIHLNRRIGQMKRDWTEKVQAAISTGDTSAAEDLDIVLEAYKDAMTLKTESD